MINCLEDDNRVLDAELIGGQALGLPGEQLALVAQEASHVERLGVHGQLGQPVAQVLDTLVLGLRRQVGDERGAEQAELGQLVELSLQLGHLRVPAVVFALELVEQVLRRASRLLGLLELDLEARRLRRRLLERLAQQSDAVVHLAQLAADRAHLGGDLLERPLQLVLLGLERHDLLQYLRELHVRLDPLREGRGGRRGALRILRLERLGVLLEQLLDALAVLGADGARIEVDDLLLDAALAEEVLDGRPGRVQVAHETQHALEYVAHGVRWRAQRPDLAQRVGLDLADGALRLVHDRLHVLELLLDLGLALRQLLVLRLDLHLELLHLDLLLAGALHALRDLVEGRVRLRLLLRQLLALLVRLALELVHHVLRLVQLGHTILQTTITTIIKRRLCI